MLLEAKIVHVPAPPERDADLNEYGTLGLKVRATFGEAAIDAGTPDRGMNDDETDAVDAVANILHYVHQQGGDPERVLRVALMHFEAENSGDPE